jgi:hypothetical protein
MLRLILFIIVYQQFIIIIMAIKFLDLPEILLFRIVSYVAGPTERVSVLCHQIAPLCSIASKVLREEQSPLWSAILMEDYGVDPPDPYVYHESESSSCKRKRRLTKQQNLQLPSLSFLRRCSKRLQQTNVIQRIRDAHNLTRDHTEIAYYHWSELCINPKPGISRARLISLLREFHVQPRINRRTSTGGTFLVECCRARHVRESTILRCVRELIKRWGANTTIPTQEDNDVSLTALCVAAARAMPTVVKYLLLQPQKHFSDEPIAKSLISLVSSGRFRLATNPRRTVHCRNSTPLEFVNAMYEAERNEGAKEVDLINLNKVRTLLEGAARR